MGPHVYRRAAPGFGRALAIVARMDAIAVVREAEPWTTANIAGAVVLLVATIVLLAWAIRRYLRG